MMAHIFLQNCFNTLASATFGDFRKKNTKRTWLCVGISPVRYAPQTW